ncbi:MAG: ATP-dependent DNA helicase [Chlorobia bacterium]|nr:ATP-dependent DNA helicase [Fimbriimonadaceae bacterium]
MSTVSYLIEEAFSKLRDKPGFVDRPDQHQLALLISDMIEGPSTGAIEAPTGLGKSLAALIPAIAHAMVSGKRTVIATYTNVLAEQYWRKDLPLAMSLFEASPTVKAAKTAFLIGRQRYACLTSLYEHMPDMVGILQMNAELGIETEFRSILPLKQRELTPLWQKISAPPVCPGRLCNNYNDCFYYRGRRQAEKAQVVITNHSVVIQDALLAKLSDDGKGLLGDYDFLILDEAHDFPQAAVNGLEFELSGPRIGSLIGVSARLENALQPLAKTANDEKSWHELCHGFREGLDKCQKALIAYSLQLGQPGILTMTPEAVMQHPQVKSHEAKGGVEGAREVANLVAREAMGFVKTVEKLIEEWKNLDGLAEQVRQATDTIRNYLSYIREFGGGSSMLFEPEGVAVSYVGRSGADAMLRQDVIDLAAPLTELLWDKTPYVCMSATLATDGNFDFFRRTTGAEPMYEEILPSPFDFASATALYLPKPGAIPDPSQARKEGNEESYFRALAREISEIIRACGGRTLALFHSRREMEGVMAHIDLPPDLPVMMQAKYGFGTTGERFKENTKASLFALRSFWTGFDAPGETLSCVILVRVPFEVPIDPPQVARLAWMHTNGMDAFGSHTLPIAKMMMRQGAGRLIRRSEDKGVIALLDPRLISKRYGEEILANLPPEMRTFNDIADAVGWVGLGWGTKPRLLPSPELLENKD